MKILLTIIAMLMLFTSCEQKKHVKKDRVCECPKAVTAGKPYNLYKVTMKEKPTYGLDFNDYYAAAPDVNTAILLVENHVNNSLKCNENIIRKLNGVGIIAINSSAEQSCHNVLLIPEE